MRNILFKAKTCNGKWVQGLLAHKDNKWYISNKEGIPFAFEVIPETIGQYTGLKDKNGTKIWENDIVRHEDLSNGRYIFIEQPMKNSSIVFNRNESKFERSDGRGLYKSNTRLEVVGNIFDNPELLEEKECEE